MDIGIPKEIKDKEARVGATPQMVRSLVQHGHKVKVQTKAGELLGYTDLDYRNAGALIAKDAAEAYDVEMVIKVKEPQSQEFSLMPEGLILFGFLHLAPDPEQTQALLDKKVIGVAYETISDDKGRLPLLAPMSEVAGRLAPISGAWFLQLPNQGAGVLLGGVPGVAPGKVVILGGGVAGKESLKMAIGLRADVTVFDRNLQRIRELEDLFGDHAKICFSNPSYIEEAVSQADLVIGSVLIPGKKAPRIVTESMVKKMKEGSVIVDISIDQGGCIETARPTTHSFPTYVQHGVVHYCVTNMPAAYARSSTLALTHATEEYALMIANKGVKAALSSNPYFLQGLNVCKGHVTHPEVAKDLGYDYVAPLEALKHC